MNTKAAGPAGKRQARRLFQVSDAVLWVTEATGIAIYSAKNSPPSTSLRAFGDHLVADLKLRDVHADADSGMGRRTIPKKLRRFMSMTRRRWPG